MTAICPTCGAECRIVSSSRRPGVDGTNYYAPFYNEEVYTSLLEILRWFGASPEHTKGEVMLNPVVRAQDVVARIKKARAS